MKIPPMPRPSKKQSKERPDDLMKLTCPECGETSILALVNIRQEYEVMGVKDKVVYLPAEPVQTDTLDKDLYCQDCNHIWTPGFLDFSTEGETE